MHANAAYMEGMTLTQKFLPLREEKAGLISLYETPFHPMFDHSYSVPIDNRSMFEPTSPHF